MADDEFWELIDGLGGVADEQSVARLAGVLAKRPRRTVSAFETALERCVDRLMDSAAMPEDFACSDTGEWLAAAVVAAGRTAYEQALGADEPLDEDDWEFGEAEELLLVTEEILNPSQLGKDLQIEWLASTFPDDVETEDPLEAELGLELGPEWGTYVPQDDELSGARWDIEHAQTWREWFDAQPTRPGCLSVSIEDDAVTGLHSNGRPPDFRYVVPAQRLLEAADRRTEMRRVLVEAWTAVAAAVGWQPPPGDPGPQ